MYNSRTYGFWIEYKSCLGELFPALAVFLFHLKLAIFFTFARHLTVTTYKRYYKILISKFWVPASFSVFLRMTYSFYVFCSFSWRYIVCISACSSDADCPWGYNFTCNSARECECPSSYVLVNNAVCFYSRYLS
jgi:hypothetical protein